MRTNKLKAKLSAGELVVGIVVPYPSPHIVELSGALGFDFVYIDCEHGPMGLSEVEDMVRAAEVYEMTPIARVPENAPPAIVRLLDRGVMGVVVPHISSRAEAEAAVRASKYYPEGERSSFPSGRASDFGTRGLTARQFYEHCNRETMVIALVESVEGLKNIDEIASLPGIDLVNIGSNDLAQSMGLPEPKKVEQAIYRIIDAALKAGKAVGVGGFGLASMDKNLAFIGRGARCFGIGADDLLRQASAQALSQARRTVPAKTR